MMHRWILLPHILMASIKGSWMKKEMPAPCFPRTRKAFMAMSNVCGSRSPNRSYRSWNCILQSGVRPTRRRIRFTITISARRTFLTSSRTAVMPHSPCPTGCSRDIFEEAGPRWTPFHGGFGLINYQDINKPAFYAYQFLNRLGPTELKNSDPGLVDMHRHVRRHSGVDLGSYSHTSR